MTLRWHPLEYVEEPITAVRQHPQNPNNGDDEEVATSMQVNGVYKGISAQRSTGFILEGHTRYVALLSLGAQSIFVNWLDVDDVEALRILLVDNASARKAHMDLVQLGENLEAIYQAEPGLALLGTGHDMDLLEHLRGMDTTSPLEFDENEFAKQRSNGQALTCPKCGFEFGGKR